MLDIFFLFPLCHITRVKHFEKLRFAVVLFQKHRCYFFTRTHITKISQEIFEILTKFLLRILQDFIPMPSDMSVRMIPRIPPAEPPEFFLGISSEMPAAIYPQIVTSISAGLSLDFLF